MGQTAGRRTRTTRGKKRIGEGGREGEGKKRWFVKRSRLWDYVNVLIPYAGSPSVERNGERETRGKKGTEVSMYALTVRLGGGGE